MQPLRAPTSIAGQNNHRIVLPHNGNTYSLNGEGCVLVQQSNLAWFISQGFNPPDSLINDLFAASGVIASGTASVALGILPANYYIEDIVLAEAARNAITGPINIGSSAGDNDIVAALAVGANALIVVPNASVLKRAFSTIAPTNLFVSAVTSWNGASINVKALLRS